MTGLNQSFHGENAQGLTNGTSGEPALFDEFPLGRQRVSLGHLAAQNAIAQMIGKYIVRLRH